MNSSPVTQDGASRRRFGWVEAAVGGTLVLLLCHAWMYWFLTDDAFISFRYARNLADGYGLVFNPGFERVEGYSNFLWVLLLALGDWLGVPPENLANPLSLTATVGLWGLVVWFVYRTPPEAGRRWLLLIAPLFLAATRSVAVWSTSGLETRLFELLVVGGALRLVVEVEAQLAGRARRAWSGLLFALAALTRPDGLLISLAAMGTAAGWLIARAKLGADEREADKRLANGDAADEREADARVRAHSPAWLRFAEGPAIFALIVGGHFVFRFAYYGEWLPNTYYAKVGGETWWAMGLVYLTLCVLEYAAYLWIPLLIAGVYARVRAGAGFVPLLIGAIVLPHAFYIAAIGGDHFEYRPLDLYFPLAFILLYDGARHLVRSARDAWIVGVYLVVMLVGLTSIGWQSHRQFTERYNPSFPGRRDDWVASLDFLSPAHDPVYRWPGLDEVAELHRSLLRLATERMVGIRQEEHRLFCAGAIERGRLHRRLVEEGIWPADAHIVLSCVGAVSYYSDLRVLDALGLTDAQMARAPRQFQERILAHDVRDNDEYIAEADVDFQAWREVGCLIAVANPDWPETLLNHYVIAPGVSPNLAAKVSDGYYLIGSLPQGIEHARARFPKLTFVPLSDREATLELLQSTVDQYRTMIAEGRADWRHRLALVDAAIAVGADLDELHGYVREVVNERPTDVEALTKLAIVAALRGEREESRAAAERAVMVAVTGGFPDAAAGVREGINAIWMQRWGTPALR